MQLHNLIKYRAKHKKRVGRGGKRGTTAGRGTKGQKSRAGRRIRPAERDLIIRIPKRRGFRNKPSSSKPTIFNLGDLAKAFWDEEKKGILDADFLKKKGLLSADFRGNVKILGNGDVKAAIEVRGLTVSRGAREKIIKAGGKVT